MLSPWMCVTSCVWRASVSQSVTRGATGFPQQAMRVPGWGGGGPWCRETWHVLPSVAVASEAEHRLFERLFEDYNEIIRPVANVSDPVIIQFEVSMSQLVKVVSAGAATGAWGVGLGRASPRTSQVFVFRHPLLSLLLGRSQPDHGDQPVAQTSEWTSGTAAPWWCLQSLLRHPEKPPNRGLFQGLGSPALLHGPPRSSPLKSHMTGCHLEGDSSTVTQRQTWARSRPLTPG